MSSLVILVGPTPYEIGSFACSFFSASNSRITYTCSWRNGNLVSTCMSTWTETKSNWDRQSGWKQKHNWTFGTGGKVPFFFYKTLQEKKGLTTHKFSLLEPSFCRQLVSVLCFSRIIKVTASNMHFLTACFPKRHFCMWHLCLSIHIKTIKITSNFTWY